MQAAKSQAIKLKGRKSSAQNFLRLWAKLYKIMGRTFYHCGQDFVRLWAKLGLVVVITTIFGIDILRE